MKINVLGTEYTVEIRDASYEDFNDKLGWCDWQQKQIVICNLKTKEGWKGEPIKAIRYKEKEVLRHEIIHAFLYESGLHSNSNADCGQWALNEEMIDWFAIQFPKLSKTFYEVEKILDGGWKFRWPKTP